MGVVLFRLIVGGLAGFLVWLIREPSAPGTGPEFGRWESTTMLLFGLILGGSLGALEGYARGGARRAFYGLALGAMFGAVGATAGSNLGEGVARLTFGPDAFEGAKVLIARPLAFSLIGLSLGAAIGGSQLSVKRLTQGAIGGLLGGIVTGMLFDPIGAIFGIAQLAAQGMSEGEVGAMPRAIFFTVMGATIGIMIGLVSRIARTAWIRHTVGRNEGREWEVEKVRTVIGRDERADIGLFGDPNVAPYHAVIDRVGKDQYVLQPAAGATVTLEGMPVVAPALLAPGHRIGVGSFQLSFHLRKRAAPAPGFQPPPPLPTLTPVAQVPTPLSDSHSAARPAATVPGPRLAIRSGPLAGQVFTLTRPLDVGREAEFRLTGDTEASRRHARFTPSGPTVAVEDLGSTNGVWSNGQKVSSVTLQPGDQVRVGTTVFELLA